MNLNDTSDFHINEISTLKWELTLSCMLENENNFCRKILKNSSTYGSLLFNFLNKNIEFSEIKSVIEVGGGYGWLTRDFLNFNKKLKSLMIDISGPMMNLQKLALRHHDVEFVNCDFLSCSDEILKNCDLLIMNEVIADLPTITGFNTETGNFNQENLKFYYNDSLGIIQKYSLETGKGDFNFNYGAVKAIEKICSNSVPYAFISEHSCEATAPENLKEIFNFSNSRFPEEIKLLGHSEYTIKFSHLEKIAASYGYKTIRGQYIDFMEINSDNSVNFALRSNSSRDDLEAIRQFIYDLYKYEYMILIKKA